MKRDIVTKGLSAGSLFKILLIGLGFSMGPLIILVGILSVFGAETIRWNDKPVTGVSGFLLSLIMAPVFVVVFSSVNWLFLMVGNGLYTRFKNITIRYIGVESLELLYERKAARQSSVGPDVGATGPREPDIP